MDASSSQSVSDTDSIFPEIDSTSSFLDSTSSLQDLSTNNDDTTATKQLDDFVRS